MVQKKSFILDTNILLSDHAAMLNFEDSDIFLPQIVLQEMDSKKNSRDKTVGYNARSFIKMIKQLMKEQQTYDDLVLPNNSFLTILPTKSNDIASILSKAGLERTPDNEIVATGLLLKKQGKRIILITNDSNLWITAMSQGLEVDDYDLTGVRSNQYTGVKVIQLESSEIIDRFYSGEDVLLDELEYSGLYPNQILVMKVEGISSLIARFMGYDKPLKKCKKKESMNFSGVKPLNKEQSFAFELLDDDSIPCVTLAGRAGTGKSICTLAYAMDNLHKYEKILILKPVIPVGQDLGFLPGTLEEKLAPWIKSFTDTLDFIFNSTGKQKSKPDVFEQKSYGKFKKDDAFIDEKSYKYIIESGQLEFQPLAYLRGRSICNTLIILDESQNTSLHEIKTLVTRIGEGSKVICLGDIDQIDSPYLDKYNNGLSCLIEKGKHSDLVGHITFIKSHRSKLSDWASEAL